jgi:hypothetical protein
VFKFVTCGPWQQPLFVAGVVVVGVIADRILASLPTWVPRLPAHIISAVEAFWKIERLAKL